MSESLVFSLQGITNVLSSSSLPESDWNGSRRLDFLSLSIVWRRVLYPGVDDTVAHWSGLVWSGFTSSGRRNLPLVVVESSCTSLTFSGL